MNAHSNDWVKLEGKVSSGNISALAGNGAIERLSLTKMPTLTARIAKGFSALPSVERLWLWCDVTRTAMRHIFAISGLRELDVLNLVKPGQLLLPDAASSLEVFRGNHYLTERDLMEISRCKSLRELGAQSADLSTTVINALLDMPQLVSLDLEGSKLDDSMAQRIGTSLLLTSIDVGATRITGVGLSHLCKMKQLRSLDLWATSVKETDLDLLSELPNLEYLSVGAVEGSPSFCADSLIPKLYAIPSLKRIWLDGVSLEPRHKSALEAKYEKVRLT